MTIQQYWNRSEMLYPDPEDNSTFMTWRGPVVTYADHVAALLTQDRQHGEQSHGHYMDGYAAALDAARDAVEAVGQQHPKWDLMSTHYEDCWRHHSECALTLALAAIDGIRKGGSDAD